MDLIIDYFQTKSIINFVEEELFPLNLIKEKLTKKDILISYLVRSELTYLKTPLLIKKTDEKKALGGGNSRNNQKSLIFSSFKTIYPKLLKKIDEISDQISFYCHENSKKYVERILNELKISYEHEDIETFSKIYDKMDGVIVNNYTEFLNVNNSLYEFYQLFVPMKFQIIIENTKVFEINLGTERLKFRIITNKETSNPSYFHTLLCDTAFWMRNLVDGKNKLVNVSIVDFITEKKHLPKNKDFISRINVNSGYTFLGNPAVIVIFRREEIVKVLIHELLHAFDIDRNVNKNTKLLETFRENMKITTYEFSCNKKTNRDFLMNEAYTETMATIFHCLFILKCLKINNTSFIDLLLKYERYWSLYQTAKILNYFGFTNFEEFVNSDLGISIQGGKISGEKEIQEHTNVTAYYIVKSSILFSLDSFLEHINFYGIKYDNLNDFVFSLFIIDGFKNKKFINSINKILDKFKHFDNSLRLTCLELSYENLDIENIEIKKGITKL